MSGGKKMNKEKLLKFIMLFLCVKYKSARYKKGLSFLVDSIKIVHAILNAGPLYI
jgi:hypothetical protein